MAASTALESVADIESFLIEYYAAWGGTDEDRIMSYYADNVTVQIPGSLMQGKSAVREQFVRPFITGFPGNRHFVKNIVFGRHVAVVELRSRPNTRVHSLAPPQPMLASSCRAAGYTGTTQRAGRSLRPTSTSMWGHY